MSIIGFVVFYFIMVIIVYLFLSFMVESNIGIDKEFDDAMSDKSARMLALLTTSLFWFITIPIIIIYNIFKGRD